MQVRHPTLEIGTLAPDPLELIALRPDAGLRTLRWQRRGHAGAEQEADDERQRAR
ncbi:MAG: hypothetical protein LH467_04280 [Gemmatimonadaceae bacterium]|nr:hypothetical protein [Gemmatimonadaceae bacterium]